MHRRTGPKIYERETAMRTKKTGLAVKIALTVFMVFCLVTIFKLKLELDALERERVEIQTQVDEARDYLRRLENRLSEKYDEEYIQKVAREKLNLVLPEEIIFYNDISG